VVRETEQRQVFRTLLGYELEVWFLSQEGKLKIEPANILFPINRSIRGKKIEAGAWRLAAVYRICFSPAHGSICVSSRAVNLPPSSLGISGSIVWSMTLLLLFPFL
jgi:hypothetical protein